MNRISTFLLITLITFLAACAKPPAHYSDDHAVWLERVKKAGW